MDLAFSISLEFSKNFRKKYGKSPYNITKVKESKWWAQFIKASTFIMEEDVVGFMIYFFKQDFGDSIIFPYLLNNKRGKEIYKDFVDLKKTQSEVEVKDKISYTIREISSWCKKQDIKENKIENFVKDRNNLMRIERNMFYKPMFYFSKEYMKDRYVEDLDIRKAIFMRRHRNVYDVLKKISGEDFLD